MLAAFQQLKQKALLSGVIFASFGEEKLLRRVTGLGIPTVLLDHDSRLPQISSVREDSFAAARLAIEHLAGLGHRRIATAHWQRTDLNPWRLDGYRQGLRDAGLARRRAWEFPVELTERGAAAAESLLSLSSRPTAIYCFNNTLAKRVIQNLSGQGIRVPDDISVLGGGGEEVLGLTCHQANWLEMGRTAVQILQRLQGETQSHEPEHRLLPHTLRPGQTTAPPA